MILNPIIDAFAAKHGTYEKAGNRYLFEDGAVAVESSDRSTSYTLTDPPTDELELLKAKREFVQARLNREVAAFNDYRNETIEQLNFHRANPLNIPAPPATAEDDLRKGAERIQAVQQQLDELELSLNKHDPQRIHNAQLQEEISRRQQEISSRYQNISSIAY